MCHGFGDGCVIAKTEDVQQNILCSYAPYLPSHTVNRLMMPTAMFLVGLFLKPLNSIPIAFGQRFSENIFIENKKAQQTGINFHYVGL